MSRENRSISVDPEKYAKISKDYSIAKIVDIMFDSYLSDETQDITLTLQTNQIDAALFELTEKLRTAEEFIRNTNARIAYLEDRKETLKTDFARAKRIRLLNTYYSEFNGLCINSGFELSEVKKNGALLIEKIKVVDPSFDPESRMKRYKTLLDEF